jgi:hypothetical protein
MPTYLAEMERQTGRNPQTLPHIRGWALHSEFEALPGEEQLPLCVVVSPGLVDEPTKDGAGAYRTKWGLAVAVVVSANTPEASRTLVGLYAAAARGSLLQRRSLGGVARGVEWLDERYDDLDINDERSLAAARLVFAVDVGDVVSVKEGPVEPDPEINHHDPYSVSVVRDSRVDTEKVTI